MEIKPDIRFLNDMKGVICDQKWAKTAPNFELYYMYRAIEKKDGLRYDITEIPPRMLGQEFVKTKGHSHSATFGEIYIVLEGEALYLIQNYRNNEIEDVYAVRAKKGEVVVVPPHYGHVTINPSAKDTLKEANWVCESCQNIYDGFLEKKGACYYYTLQGWIKNENYARIPKLRFEKALKSMPENIESLLYGR